jgi:hypothetical protein
MLFNVTFITEIDGEQQKFEWGNDKRTDLVMDEWFNLKVCTIDVKKSKSVVKFSVLQVDLDWKYDLSIDYVELVPKIE